MSEQIEAASAAWVHALTPGDVVELGFHRALFVTRCEHPIWPHLQLVIWRLPDGSWSHDALDPRQLVGTVEPATPLLRDRRLHAALVGQQDWTQQGEPDV